MENITKRFPGVVANQNVHLRVVPGTFHAVIGENGAGKSTLLNILYGRYRPDAGRIFVEGEEVTHALRTPADAIRRGIGLVSQHYALIPALTVIENVMLGAERGLPGGIVAATQSGRAGAADLRSTWDWRKLDLNTRAERLSVAAQQKVEILKALYRGARILLLDEPTATLAPQEVESLFALLHTLAAQGSTILFVTHKLREVMAHSHYVSVLRAGQSAGDFVTAQTNEAGTAARHDRRARQCGATLLNTEEGNDRSTECGIRKRQIRQSAIANRQFRPTPFPFASNRKCDGAECAGRGSRAKRVAGCGAGRDRGHGGRGRQRAARTFRSPCRPAAHGDRGACFWTAWTSRACNVRQRQQAGIAYIPEDRHRAGMILDFSIAENYLLGHEREPAWGGGLTLDTGLTAVARPGDGAAYDVRGGTAGRHGTGRRAVGRQSAEGRVCPRDGQRPAPARRLPADARPGCGSVPFRLQNHSETRRAEGLGVLLFSLDLDEFCACRTASP